ncbi:MAG: hypothetical protein HQ518_14705 [Rhodopirellula sp.]|nr:hypothetical protein [Rhodopirellula sp.]
MNQLIRGRVRFRPLIDHSFDDGSESVSQRRFPSSLALNSRPNLMSEARRRQLD